MKFPKLQSIHILTAACLVVAGCSSSAPSPNSGTSPVNTTMLAMPTNWDGPSTLALFGLGDRMVHIGDTTDVVAAEFPPPAHHKVFPIDQLPQVIASPPYQAHGWQSDERSFGYATLQHRLVLAIQIETFQTRADADRFVQAFVDENVTLVHSFDRVDTYRASFWQSGDQRLMVLEDLGTPTAIKVTVILGVNSLMDAIGAARGPLVQDLQELQTELKDTTPPPTKK